jgi:hypothetical protein
MSDENKKYVPEGVFLVCDMGATPSQLIASPRKINLYGPMMATDADNKFTSNILPFGVCKKLQAPCAFGCVQWTKVKSGNVFANGEKPLLEDSEALCPAGQGKIKIFFDKYEADLANENNNESAFVSEEISSSILGGILTTPFGNIIDLFCDDDDKFTEGVGRGFKKGLEGTWNFLTNDMWKGETWEGLGKMVVIGAAYSGPMGLFMGETHLQNLDKALGTDFVQTKDALVEGVDNAASNAWEDVKRGNMGEVGESVGQIQYAVVEAVVGTKGAGLVVKGLSTGAKALIGAERLAALSAKISKFANALKQGVLSVVKVGRKPLSFIDEVTPLVKTGPNEAFYWSGRVNGKGVMDQALEIAKSKGGTTLEGIIDSKKIKMPKWEDNPKVWEDVSAAYANQASGEVRAVLGTELRPGNVWETVELPRLKENPNVTKITVINAETLEETVIFVR